MVNLLVTSDRRVFCQRVERSKQILLRNRLDVWICRQFHCARFDPVALLKRSHVGDEPCFHALNHQEDIRAGAIGDLGCVEFCGKMISR